MFVPVLTILNELEDESSTLKKQEIIKKYSTHEEFMRTLSVALNPFKLYYIKKIPEYNVGKPYLTLSSAIRKLNSLSERSITGNRAVMHLQEILECVEFDDAQVLERIIKKDLRCGVGGTLVNKALDGDYIPKPVYSGCNKYNDKTKSTMNYPAIIQTKMDAQYANAVVVDGKVEWFTRQGKPLNLSDATNLNNDVVKYARSIDIIYGGELLIDDSKGGYLDRKTGNGIINKLSKFQDVYAKAKASKKPELLEHYNDNIEKLRYVFWDVITPMAFYFYHGRVNTYNCKQIVDAFNNTGTKYMKFVETEIVNDEYEANNFFERQLELGREGAVLKQFTHSWKNGKDNSQLKMKSFNDAEFKIAELVEGTGKYKGKLGSFLVESLDGTIKSGVGTGFSDEDRVKYYDKKYLGKLVTVKYTKILEDINGDNSLEFPVMVEVDPIDK